MIMGGGNGQKSMMALQKHMEKQKTVKGSQLESNKKAMSIQCKVCMQHSSVPQQRCSVESMLKQSIPNPIFSHVFRSLKNDNQSAV
ncbi:hypothetical protein SLE2022_259800 [Rubroshorea leprosula]